MTVLETVNLTKSAKLQTLALSMQSAIDAKMNPASADQRVTARRAKIIDSIAEDGKKLQKIQSALFALARCHESGNVPNHLSKITNKKQLEMLLKFSSGWFRDNIDRVWLSEAYEDETKPLVKLGLTTIQDVTNAVDMLNELVPNEQVAPVDLQIKRLERGLLGCKISGYFPTPDGVIELMLDKAELEDGMRVLEPSAGKGSIAQQIIKAAKVNLDVLEINEGLREILLLKGFTLVGRDFLGSCGFKPTSRDQYDRIIMNPPFENGQDIKHVIRAFEFLADGGRIVALVGNGCTFKSDKLSVSFREWLEEVGAEITELKDGAFYSSDRPTGVKVQMLVINK